MTDPFKLVSPEYAKLLNSYLDDRTLEPGDFPEGLVPTNFPKLLEERGYNARLAAGRPFIFLTYRNHDGSYYYATDDTEKENPYALARFLGGPSLWRGSEPPPKVIAQNGRPNVLHYEPLPGGQTWESLPDGTTVYHVESLIKAKVLTKWFDVPAIGLNGVDSFSSSKRGVRFLYEDQPIDFSRFKNVVLFDSNVTKEGVRDARERLMFKFKHVLGCKEVGFVDLPKSQTGEDWGPDEFLKANGPKALYDLMVEPTMYEGGEHADLLKRMERAVFCVGGGAIVDREDRYVRNSTKAREFYAKINEKTVGRGGKITTTYGYNVWIDSPHRTEVTNPAYEYKGEEFIERRGETYINTYVQSGPWPGERSDRKDVGPIVEHLGSIMKSEDLERLRAYAKFLKMGNGKPTSFPVMYSDKRGVGKGWFSKLLYRLIGDRNCTNADAKAFVTNFNAQVANKRLVIVNEFKVTGQAQKDAAMNSLKRFFGDEFFAVEPKGVDSYQVENRAGMIITSNALEDVPTDGMGDRRMWYVECHAPAEEPNWNQLHAMLDDPAVMNGVFDWVAGGQNIDFATWKPPLDEARVKAIKRSSSGLDDACATVLEDARAEGVNCLRGEVILQMLKFHVPKIDEMTLKSVQLALQRNGWKVSAKKYGNTPATRRNVWVANLEAFEEHEHDSVWVAGELNRGAALLGLGSEKF